MALQNLSGVCICSSDATISDNGEPNGGVAILLPPGTVLVKRLNWLKVEQLRLLSEIAQFHITSSRFTFDLVKRNKMLSRSSEHGVTLRNAVTMFLLLETSTELIRNVMSSGRSCRTLLDVLTLTQT